MATLDSLLPATSTERLRRLPLSRDQLMLLLAAFNLVLLGLETYLAHLISGTIRPREWIPILFGPAGGIVLLIAGVIALRRRNAATMLATIVLVASIVVGLLGSYFHVVRGSLPSAPMFERISISLLVWAPPVVGPLVFSLVGLWGISAAFVEEPVNSGRLRLWGNRHLQLPYSKTRAYLFMASLGTLATVFSSVFDHARTGFDDPRLWIPTVIGVFATVVAAGLATVREPGRWDVAVYVSAMALMLLVGLLGVYYHVRADLTGESVIIPERFLRGAPFLAPMLFSNLGLFGLIALVSPREE